MKKISRTYKYNEKSKSRGDNASPCSTPCSTLNTSLKLCFYLTQHLPAVRVLKTLFDKTNILAAKNTPGAPTEQIVTYKYEMPRKGSF